MSLQKLHLQNFRNFRELFLEFSPDGAVLHGNNGTGKTNILEAIHLLCTGKSQRGAMKREMIKSDAAITSVEGEFISSSGATAGKSVALSFDRNNNQETKINNKTIGSIADWFGSRAVVSFATSDIQLVYGMPDLRRKFLDLFISLIDKEYLLALMRYRKNLLLRNSLLKTSMDEILCEIYEEQMADASAKIVETRIALVDKLAERSSSLYQEIAGKKDDFSMSYEPCFTHRFNGKNEWKNVFFSMLAERRKTDRELGFSSCGPHRDDIGFFIDKRPAKSFASQGQCRSIVLSLKLSSILCLEDNIQDTIILLFDDAVSELDPERTARVHSLIERRGQLFVASPDPDISRHGALRRQQRFRVAADAVSVV